MTEPVWTVPSHRVDAATARRSILIQHQWIREQLIRAQDLAERALDQEALSPDAVASAIGDIHATLEIHLRFEEKVLVDIFSDDLPLGPTRAARLHDEHAHQRAMLAGIHGEAKRGPQVPMLAAKLAFLTRWLLDDMDEEERTTLHTLDVGRDGAPLRRQSQRA
jgi:hypothetical protein